MSKKLGELELIERISATVGASRSAEQKVGVNLGIGDDCAILRPPPKHDILVTTDFSLEDRHFRRDWHPPESVGHRCLARGLSDLAAMGAKPLAAFLSLALPAEMLATAAGRRWIDGFLSGMQALGRRFSVQLAGGDTAEAPAAPDGSSLVLADIVLIGSAPRGRALRRSGGKAGDLIYVTGALGGAAAELDQMRLRGEKRAAGGKAKRTAFRKREDSPRPNPQLYPEPRVELGMALLRRKLATAGIDLSDGLSTDLAHLCRASCVGAEIEVGALPVHPLASKAGAAAAQAFALHGGEDYELLFMAPKTVQMPQSVAGVKVTRIGRLVPGKGVWLLSEDSRKTVLPAGGWQHFRSKT